MAEWVAAKEILWGKVPWPPRINNPYCTPNTLLGIAQNPHDRALTHALPQEDALSEEDRSLADPA
jgi:hypothetical protein